MKIKKQTDYVSILSSLMNRACRARRLGTASPIARLRERGMASPKGDAWPQALPARPRSPHLPRALQLAKDAVQDRDGLIDSASSAMSGGNSRMTCSPAIPAIKPSSYPAATTLRASRLVSTPQISPRPRISVTQGCFSTSPLSALQVASLVSHAGQELGRVDGAQHGSCHSADQRVGGRMCCRDRPAPATTPLAPSPEPRPSAARPPIGLATAIMSGRMPLCSYAHSVPVRPIHIAPHRTPTALHTRRMPPVAPA